MPSKRKQPTSSSITPCWSTQPSSRLRIKSLLRTPLALREVSRTISTGTHPERTRKQKKRLSRTKPLFKSMQTSNKSLKTRFLPRCRLLKWCWTTFSSSWSRLRTPSWTQILLSQSINWRPSWLCWVTTRRMEILCKAATLCFCCICSLWSRRPREATTKRLKWWSSPEACWACLSSTRPCTSARSPTLSSSTWCLTPPNSRTKPKWTQRCWSLSLWLPTKTWPVAWEQRNENIYSTERVMAGTSLWGNWLTPTLPTQH